MTKLTLDGRELSAVELEQIRQQIEAFDSIEAVSDQMRDLIASQYQHFLVNLNPPTKNYRQQCRK